MQCFVCLRFAGHRERDAEPGQELRQGSGGGGEDDSRAVGHQECWQARPQETSGGEGGRINDQQRGSAPRSHVGHHRFQIIKWNYGIYVLSI